MSDLRSWRSHGVTHVVREMNGPWALKRSSIPWTACNMPLFQVPWRNTSKLRRGRIDCMACVATMTKDLW